MTTQVLQAYLICICLDFYLDQKCYFAPTVPFKQQGGGTVMQDEMITSRVNWYIGAGGGERGGEMEGFKKKKTTNLLKL